MIVSVHAGAFGEDSAVALVCAYHIGIDPEHYRPFRMHGDWQAGIAIGGGGEPEVGQVIGCEVEGVAELTRNDIAWGHVTQIEIIPRDDVRCGQRIEVHFGGLQRTRNQHTRHQKGFPSGCHISI